MPQIPALNHSKLLVTRYKQSELNFSTRQRSCLISGLNSSNAERYQHRYTHTDVKLWSKSNAIPYSRDDISPTADCRGVDEYGNLLAAVRFVFFNRKYITFYSLIRLSNLFGSEYRHLFFCIG